jgi:hypothetical protein
MQVASAYFFYVHVTNLYKQLVVQLTPDRL